MECAQCLTLVAVRMSAWDPYCGTRGRLTIIAGSSLVSTQLVCTNGCSVFGDNLLPSWSHSRGWLLWRLLVFGSDTHALFASSDGTFLILLVCVARSGTLSGNCPAYLAWLHFSRKGPRFRSELVGWFVAALYGTAHRVSSHESTGEL